MCGICGYIGHNIDKEVIIERMLKEIKHRGPDDSGVWLDHQLTLGHNRLSILDITKNGHQPMVRGNLVIVFNGEIYNYKEIRNELKVTKGQVFFTQTDTEVILVAWEVWGEQALEKFRGMWAFALYNSCTGELILSRDRFGIKPLYYYRDKDKFAFSSEIKALLTIPGISRKACLSTISDYLVIGYHDHRTETFFEDIKQVPAGNCLKINVRNNTHSIYCYYDLYKSIYGVKSTIEQFEEIFNETIILHLRSDVPIGACLSGGLDSSSIATAASVIVRHNNGNEFHAITAKSEDPRNDETEYARQVVERMGLTWHLTKPSVYDFQDHWDKCIWHQDEPTGGPSIFMQYWVMKKAKEVGLKVMLDGQGGDECLLGYERYYPSFLLHLLGKGRWKRALQEYMAITDNSKLNNKQLLLYALYFLSPNIRKLRYKKRIGKFPHELLVDTLTRLEDSSLTYKNIRQLQISEICKYQMPHLLKYEDRNSMAWSIEARVPFVDHKMIETALTLSPEAKIKNGYTKWALRQIMDGKMPDSITWRTNKIGFEAPTSKWMEVCRKQMTDKINKSTILKQLGLNLPKNEQLFVFCYNIACWESIYNVSF